MQPHREGAQVWVTWLSPADVCLGLLGKGVRGEGWWEQPEIDLVSYACQATPTWSLLARSHLYQKTSGKTCLWEKVEATLGLYVHNRPPASTAPAASHGTGGRQRGSWREENGRWSGEIIGQGPALRDVQHMNLGWENTNTQPVTENALWTT